MAALWFSVRPALAQEAQARIVVDPTPLTVGDVVTLRVEVDHPAETVVILPDVSEGWGELEVREQHPAVVETHEDGSLTTSQQIDAALFAPGFYQTSPLAIVVSDRSGGTSEVQPAAVDLTVNTLLTPADTEPRDLKPQAHVGGAWVMTAMVASGVLALLVAGAVLLWWRRGRVNPFARTSLQRALDELDAIAAAGYPGQGKYQELYFEVSHTMRHHLEREVGVPCDERTTAEMRSLLRPLPLAQQTQRRLLTLFQESDLVKFAHVSPNEESAAALLTEARALCREVSAAPATNAAPTGATPAPVRG